VDNGDGERQAVPHLTALGHRRIAFVEGPRTSWANRERLRALRTVTRAAGVELVEVGNFLPQFDGGVAAADLVLAARVTAVVAYNDLVALGLLNRFAARGIDVPGEMSVVGCDDIILSAMVSPSLTSIAIPTEVAGRAGVDLLLQLLGQGDRPAVTRRALSTHLMVRASTGPAPHA
jgi:DNA-binding LacI/PurR family transcriptional regulator